MVLNRIGVLSCGKVVGIIYGVIGLIQGAFRALISVVGASAQLQTGNGAMPFMANGGGMILLLPILGAVAGFIAGVIVAAVYNLVASNFGGLELEFVRQVESEQSQL